MKPARFTDRRGWWLPFAVVVLMGLLQLAAPETSDWLRYHRTLISDGQIWRLFTAHLVHLGWGHIAMNAAGLILVWWLYERTITPAAFAAWGLVSALAIGAGLWWLNPSLVWYVGLSGVLHGLLAGGAVEEICRRERGGWLILCLLVAKLLWEQVYGPLPGSASMAGGEVVVDAHLYGALGGLAAGLGRVLLLRGRATSAMPVPEDGKTGEEHGA